MLGPVNIVAKFCLLVVTAMLVACGSDRDVVTRQETMQDADLQLVSRRDGRSLGRVFSTSPDLQSELDTVSLWRENSLLLQSKLGEEIGNAFNFYTLKPGRYKIVATIVPLTKVSSGNDAVRISFASWQDSITFGEAVFSSSQITDVGSEFKAVTLGRVVSESNNAEVRITNLGAGVDFLVKDVSVFKLPEALDN
jgi:hypothetical protein